MFTDPVTAWYRGVNWTVYGVTGPVNVETLVDTGCKRCLIQYDLAKALGLDKYPVTNGGYDFYGFGDGYEKIVWWTNVDIECPIIELGRVSEQVLLVQDKKMPDILIGSSFISKHDIDLKLAVARRHYGVNLPIRVCSMTSSDQIIGPIYAGESKRMSLC